MAEKGEKKKKISKSLVVLYIIVTLIVVSAFLPIIFKKENESREKVYFGSDINGSAIIRYNDSTQNIEIIIGPIKNQDGENIENVNVSIEFNNTKYYNLSDSQGMVKLCIPEYSILKEELNTDKTITLRVEGHEEMKFVIYFNYP